MGITGSIQLFLHERIVLQTRMKSAARKRSAGNLCASFEVECAAAAQEHGPDLTVPSLTFAVSSQGSTRPLLHERIVLQTRMKSAARKRSAGNLYIYIYIYIHMRLVYFWIRVSLNFTLHLRGVCTATRAWVAAEHSRGNLFHKTYSLV